MVETSATLRMSAVDTGMVDTLNQVSAQTTNLQIAGAATTATFKGLGVASKTTAAEMAVGARSATVFSTSLNAAAISAGKITTILGTVSLGAFYLQQIGTTIDGIAKASERAVRLPTTLQAMQASGVSTAVVQDFGNLAQAVRGSDVAIDSLVTNAIAKLGRFEGAATRAGTILRSSIRFDETGTPLRADQQERLENALSIQRLVNEELRNSVTSTKALAGQYEVLSSGFTKTADSQKVLTSGLKLVGIAEAGGVAANTAQTLQLLTKTLNAYELSAADSAKTAGILNGIVENGLTTIQQLSLGFGQTAKQANQANIAIEDLGASVSVLTSQGVSTPLALTGINRVAAAIIQKTPEAEKELAKLQLRGERIRFDKAEIQAKGFTQALIDLNEAVGQSPEKLSRIFTEDVAFRTVNALLAERGQRLVKTRESIAQADTESLDQVFEIATSDRTKRFQRLSNRIEESIIKVGLSLAPTLEPGIKVLEKIADRFERLPEPIKELIGSYIALQIRTKAYGGAAGILLKTLGSLAANYLIIRTVSLALSGQLGNEIRTIKQLITQRKGLAAATLQLFGVNQRYRLSQIATTETMAQQSKVAQGLAAARARVGKVAGAAFVGATATVSGTTQAATAANIGRIRTQGIAIAQEVGRRGKEIGTAIIDKTKEQINRATESLGVRPFFVATARPTTAAAPPGVTTVPTTAAPVAPPSPGVVPATATTPRTLITPAPRGAVPPPPPRPRPEAFIRRPPTTTTLESLVAADPQVKRALKEQLKLEDDLAKAITKRGKIRGDISKLTSQSTQASNKLIKARAEAIRISSDNLAKASDKQKAFTAVQKQEATVKELNNKLDLKRLEYTQANTGALVARNRVTAATIKTEQARITAATRLKPLAIAITEAEKAQAAAIAASQAATVARYKAEQLALTQGAQSQAAIAAKTQAQLLEAKATQAQQFATLKKNIAQRRETALTLEQSLAEKGLFQSRLFGKNVVLAQTGIIGKLNKILATNITLTGLATVAEKSYAKIRALTNALFDIRNYQLIKENALLAIKNVRSLGGGLKGIITGIGAQAGSFFGGITGALGLLAPLLGTAALAAFVLRDNFFGLGKSARQLTKEYQQLTKEQDILNRKLGIDLASSNIERALASKNIANARIELIKLRDSSSITEKQFNSLIKRFPELATNSELTGARLKEFRQELKQLNLGAREIEIGINERIFGSIKKIPGAIGGLIDLIANGLGAVTVNAINAASASLGGYSGKIELVSIETIKLNREADNLIKPLSILNNLNADIGQKYLATTRAIINYRENLALTGAVQERIAGGYRLTETELKIEEKAFKAREQANIKQITIADQLIKKNEELLAKVKSPELQDLYANRIAQTQAEKENLEAQNQEFRELRSQITKYLTEELPAIQTALQEQSNPQLLLENARETYQEIFVDQNDNILKPLQTLRDEAFKLVSAINDSLAQGLFDDRIISGESVAAKELRKIRDETIKFYQNGELKKGYRLAIADRKALTQQIIALENADLQRQEQNAQLEAQRFSDLTKLKLLDETNAAVFSAELQEEQIANRIERKRAEINELRDLGLRAVNEEAQLAKLLADAETARITTQISLIERSLSDLQLRTNRINQSLTRTIFDSQSKVVALNQERQVNQQLLQVYDDQTSSQERILNLQKQITNNSVFVAQEQQRIAQERSRVLSASLPIQQKQLDFEIEITREQNKQNLLQAQIQKRQAEINLERLRGRKVIVEQNNEFTAQVKNLQVQLSQTEAQLRKAQNQEEKLVASVTLERLKREIKLAQQGKEAADKRIEQIKLEIDEAQLQINQADSRIKQAQFQIEQEDQIFLRKQQQLDLSQAEQSIANDIAISTAKRAVNEAEIERRSQARQIAIQNETSFLQLEKSALNQRLNTRVQELNLATKLTNSETERRRIAQNTATIKLDSLRKQIELDAKILASTQQQEQIQLRRDRAIATSKLDRNLADILEAQAKLEELKASGATTAQITAGEARIRAELAERQGLTIEIQRLRDRDRFLRQQQRQAREQFIETSQLKLTQAQIDALQFLEAGARTRREKRILNELLRGDSAFVRNLGEAIDRAGRVKVEIPELKVSPLEIPSLEQIAGDIKAIISEFNTDSTKSGNIITKQINIETLQLEAPINIEVIGEDTEVIVDQVEERVFNSLVSTVRNTTFEVEE